MKAVPLDQLLESGINHGCQNDSLFRPECPSLSAAKHNFRAGLMLCGKEWEKEDDDGPVISTDIGLRSFLG